jgi:hypothetical protein
MVFVGAKMTQTSRDKIKWQAIENVAHKDGGGIINEYIMFQLHSYNEPTRAGTPKGEKIGFSRDKYFACILCGITNFNMQKIAELSHTTNGVIRKWRTEKDFKAACDQHCSDFADEIIKRIGRGLAILETKVDNFLNNDGSHPFAKSPKQPLDPVERIFIDAKYFNKKVLKKLSIAAIKIRKDRRYGDGETENEPTVALAIHIGHVISYAQTGSLHSIPPHLLAVLVDDVKDLLKSNNPLSDKDRKMALIYLDLLKTQLENYTQGSKRS